MGQGTELIGRLVRVDLRNTLITAEDLVLEGKVGLVVGRDPYVRSWLVLIDGEVKGFNSAFLDVIDEAR